VHHHILDGGTDDLYSLLHRFLFLVAGLSTIEQSLCCYSGCWIRVWLGTGPCQCECGGCSFRFNRSAQGIFLEQLAPNLFNQTPMLLRGPQILEALRPPRISLPPLSNELIWEDERCVCILYFIQERLVAPLGRLEHELEHEHATVRRVSLPGQAAETLCELPSPLEQLQTNYLQHSFISLASCVAQAVQVANAWLRFCGARMYESARPVVSEVDGQD
jgi:hypothetical protein